MKRVVLSSLLLAGLALGVVLIGTPRGRTSNDEDNEESEIKRGFEIAPVRLDFDRKNRSLVGLGSYIVNGQGVCNNCHTCPSRVGHSLSDNSFVTGGTLSEVNTPGPVNKDNYLAGGVPFGPVVVSKNLTPDPTEGNLPEGLTFEQFLTVMQTGHDPDANRILQVMPWPVYRHMTERDLHAIYEYLSAIPHAEPGTTCTGPDQFKIVP